VVLDQIEVHVIHGTASITVCFTDMGRCCHRCEARGPFALADRLGLSNLFFKLRLRVAMSSLSGRGRGGNDPNLVLVGTAMLPPFCVM
jgi:hypothetical protein